MNFNALFYRLSKQIFKLQPRERVLILIAAMLAIFGIGQGILTLLSLSDPTPVIDEINKTQTMIKANEQAIVAIVERQNSNKMKQLRADELQLRQTLDQLKDLVKLNADFLIPPKEMPNILKNLLLQHAQLELVDFNTQSPIRIETVNKQLPLFSHGLSIKVKGTFPAMTSWLKAIEELPWVLNWDRLQYSIATWPKGELHLEIHTLSREESWLDI